MQGIGFTQGLELHGSQGLANRPDVLRAEALQEILRVLVPPARAEARRVRLEDRGAAAGAYARMSLVDGEEEITLRQRRSR